MKKSFGTIMNIIGLGEYEGCNLTFTYTLVDYDGESGFYTSYAYQSNIGTFLCTGEEVKPSMEIYSNYYRTLLTEGKDYKIEYKNNIDCGTASMKVIGINRYAGHELNFTYTIEYGTFTYAGQVYNDGVIGGVYYTGEEIKYPIRIIDKNGNTLKEGTDYKLVYSNNVYPGKATVDIIGIGGYKGCDLSFAFYIVDNDASSGFSSNLYTDQSNIGSFAYTGEEVRPSLGLMYSNDSQLFLIEEKDYKIEYSNNVNPGTATAKVIGINRFAGKELTFTYTIKNKSFASKDHKDAGTAKVCVIGLGYYDENELNFMYTIEKQY